MAPGRKPRLAGPPNRDLGRTSARVLCALLAFVGALPIFLGLFLKSSVVQTFAARETARALKEQLGVTANYRVAIELLPLRITLNDLVVPASDGGTAALRVERTRVTPRVFSLLSGRLDIGDVELNGARARVVIRDGKISNLDYRVPTPAKSARAKRKRAPFSSLSMSDARLDLDLDLDGVRVVTEEADLDVFTDVGPTFEVALRVGGGGVFRERVVRAVPPPPPGTLAVDEDTLCRLELRLRYEPESVLVRRLSSLALADDDPRPNTRRGCDGVAKDPNRVAFDLSQLRFGLRAGKIPVFDGHVAVSAPLFLVNRFVRARPLVGVSSFSVDLRYDARHVLPEGHGTLSADEVRFGDFNLAKGLSVAIAVQADMVDIPRLRLGFADGDVTVKNTHIEPLSETMLVRTERVDSKGMTFQGLMRDLNVTSDTVVRWDLGDLRVTKIAGALKPLKIDGEVYSETKNFEVTDRSFRDPSRKRMIGIKAALLRGRVGVRPTTFEIYDTRADFGSSVLGVSFFSIAYHDATFKMAALDGSHLDFADVSPVIGIPIAGQAEMSAETDGLSSAIVLRGDVRVKDLVFGGFALGDITTSKLRFEPLVLEVTDVQGRKGKSDFAVPRARLDFGTAASVIADARIRSQSLDLRDFFAIWHLESDPRFDNISGQTGLDATLHYALGGPEDRCVGGNLRVFGSGRIKALDLFDERYDSGDAEFDFRWLDRAATYRGVDLRVPSLTLRKGSGTLVGSFGMRQGAQVYGRFVGSAVPLSRVDALPDLLHLADGRLSAIAELGGTLDAPEMRVSGQVSPVRVGRATLPASTFEVHLLPNLRPERQVTTSRCGVPISAPFSQAEYDADAATGVFHVAGRLFGDQIRFDDLTISRQRRKVVRGEVNFSGLDLGALSELSSALGESEARLAGRLGGKLLLRDYRVEAPLESKVELELAQVDLNRGGYRLELASGEQRVEFENERLSLPGLGLTVTTPQGQRVTFDARGSVYGLAANPQIDAKLNMRPMPLGMLASLIPRAERAEGVLSGQLVATGPLSSPHLTGGFDLSHGELAVRGFPLPVTDIDIAVRVDKNELRIEKASAKVGSGSLQVSGGSPLAGFRLGGLKLAVKARDLALPVSEGIRAVADADLDVNFRSSTETSRELAHVTGDVTLRTFEYTRPVTMTADISSLAQRGKRTEVDSYDPGGDVVQFEVRLRSLRPMKLQNNLLDAELDVADDGLLLSGSNGRFGLRGGVTLRPRGKIFLRRSEFEITQGRVRFDDVTRIAPEVDVTAVTEYRRYQTNAPAVASTTSATSSGGSSAPASQGGRWRISLHAHGDADKLKVDLTSDPPLAQDDIFLLLTVGLTRAELDQAQSASVGESVALEALGSLSGADRAVTNAVPLIDEFRFGSAYSSRTGRTEPTVTIGKRLSPRIRANVTSGVADSREVRSNVVWQLSPRVSVEGSYDNVNDISSSTLGNLGAAVRWRLEFE